MTSNPRWIRRRIGCRWICPRGPDDNPRPRWPQSIRGQSLRGTTSLGITLARPHVAVRASPILAGTGSHFHLPDKEFRSILT